MLFIPKTSRFQKLQKNKIKNSPSKNLNLVFGTFGLKIMENCCLTSKQLEMVNFHLAKGTKKLGRH